MALIGDNDKPYVTLMRSAVLAIRDLNLHVFPRIKSSYGTVDENLTMSVPSDCLMPTKVFKYVGNDCVYPLSLINHPGFRPEELISPGVAGQPESPDETSSDVCFDLHNFPDNPYMRFWYMNWYYGEMYGYSESRYFGLYAWDKERGRIVFQTNGCVKAGDTIVYSYETNGDECLVVPQEAVMMLLHYTLHLYFSVTSPNKSEYHRGLFMRHKRNYNHSKITGMDRQEILDAITRGYKGAAR